MYWYWYWSTVSSPTGGEVLQSGKPAHDRRCADLTVTSASTAILSDGVDGGVREEVLGGGSSDGVEGLGVLLG